MNWLKKAVRLKCGFLFLSLSLDSFAWSAKGHEWIAEQAFAKLGEGEFQYYQGLLELMVLEETASPGGKRKSLHFVAVYPDRVRDVLLEKIFLHNETTLPYSLIHRAKNTTSSWHYHNEVKRTQGNAHCRFQNHGQLLIVLDEIDKALNAPLSKKQEAVLLSFQIHLIQDLHQPLHTFTNLSDSCKSDLGGNKTCFQVGFFGKCKASLHALWDSGFEVFERKSSTPMNDLFVGRPDAFRPELWLQENQRYYRDVYDVSYPGYLDRAQVIASDRIGLAVSRLVNYLKQHHKRKNPNASE